MKLSPLLSYAMMLSMLLAWASIRTVDGVSSRRLRAMQGDCPLCVAEDNCHMACNEVRRQSPGSEYCLSSCNGAHPGDTFGEDWFARADRQREESRQLDARIKELGRQLAEDAQ